MKLKSISFMLLFIFFCGAMQAQDIEIKGIISSATDNETLPGVTVVVKGTSNGTITDIDGAYTLKVPSDAILEFSFIGFKKQEEKVDGRKSIDILMMDDTKILGEVIAVGYRTERKADLTGAVSVVDVSEMMSAAENNPMKSLQGRIPGMQVTSDGSPSGEAKITIRGIATLGGESSPLYIIDGVPSESGMHELNSNDIESIQVLRDASAASIYGSRAASGVIIITTKKGKKGTLKVQFDTYATMSMYQSKLKMLNSKEYAQVTWQSLVNSGADPNTNNLNIVYKDYIGPQGNRILQDIYVPEYLDSDKTMLTANTDWFDEVTRKGFAQSYNLSVSSGSDNGSHYFSLGYYDNNGLIKDTDFSRFSARMNSDYKILGDIITIGENFALNRTSEVADPGNILEQALRAVPLIPVYTADGKNWGGPPQGLPDRHNPARLLNDNKDNRYNMWRLLGNTYINIQPIKKLNIRSNLGLDYSNFYKRTLTYSYNTGYMQSDRTRSLLEQAHWMKWTWSNTATYDFQIGKNRIETLAGMEMFKQEDLNFSAKREGFAVESPDYMWPDLGTGISEGMGYNSAYALMSFFGKASYSYDERYLASVTLRRDGSSRFGRNNRWGTFPAFNLGWRISQEGFMKNTKNYLSDLKLRFGWGTTGNQKMDNRAIYTIFSPYYGKGDPIWNPDWGTAYDLDGKGSGLLSSGFRRDQLENPDLKWETSIQTNIGLDYSFFNQKLYGAVEYYIKKTKDLLYTPNHIGTIGEGGQKTYNGANIDNKGFEFSIGYRGETASGFSYDVTGNISTNKNKVTYLPESVKFSYGGNNKWDNILGRPLGSFYGYVADGIFKSQEELDKHAMQNGKGLGRIRYSDLNNDGVIDEDDQTWIGSPFPDFAYGLNITLGYKNFDLMLYLQGLHNVDVINDVKRQTDFWSVDDTRSNKGQRLLDAWDPITNPNSNIPRIAAKDDNDEKRVSTYYVENGSYLKLRNTQLGYTLPKNISKKIKMERLRFYLSGQNLFTIKSKSFTGMDPENANYGYPIPLTFTFGFNASF